MTIKQIQGGTCPHLFLACRIPLLFLLAFFLLAPPPLSASTRYITPTAEIAVRRGQGVDFKITAMVKDGTSVELLEEVDNYSRIRLDNGKEGWVLKRFLSVDPPPAEQIASLQSEKEELEATKLTLQENVAELSANLAETRTQLDATLQERDQALAAFQKLEKETANVVQIRKEMAATKEANQRLTREISAVKENNEELKNSFAIKWFLAGGGVLLLGMIIGGSASGKSRRRKSLQL